MKLSAVELDRSKPPSPGHPSRISFPKFFVRKFPGGFKVFVIENHNLPIVSMGFVMKGGSMFDGSLPGLGSMTSELLTKGTKKRTATEIAEEIDYVGGSLSTSCSWDASEVFASVLRTHLKVGIDLLQDIVLHADFPEDEIGRLKVQRIAALQQMRADPGYLADTRFASVIFGEHPYGKSPGGSEESIRPMSRGNFISFHERACTPDNSFMVFAGDIVPEEAERYVSRYFAKWKAERKFVPVPPPKRKLSNGKVVIVDKPGAVQSSIRIGGVGIARGDESYLKTFVMNTLLGGYFSSRINMNLRETHGYTYGGRSAFDARILPGLFAVSADVRNEVTGETVSEVFKELNLIRETLPAKEELELVKKYLHGLFPIQLETPQQVARRVIALDLYHLPKGYYKDYRQNIEKVTARDIRSAAKRYIPEKLAIVVSGNSREISPMLSKFGKIEIVDAEGNKIG